MHFKRTTSSISEQVYSFERPDASASPIHTVFQVWRRLKHGRRAKIDIVTSSPLFDITSIESVEGKADVYIQRAGSGLGRAGTKRSDVSPNDRNYAVIRGSMLKDAGVTKHRIAELCNGINWNQKITPGTTIPTLNKHTLVRILEEELRKEFPELPVS